MESSDAATGFVVTLSGAFLRALEPADDHGLAEQWNRLAGFWRGAELELGAVYQVESELPFPRVNGRVLPMLLEFGASAWVPCTPAPSKVECVELVVHAYPDPGRVSVNELYEELYLDKDDYVDRAHRRPHPLFTHDARDGKEFRGPVRDARADDPVLLGSVNVPVSGIGAMLLVVLTQ